MFVRQVRFACYHLHQLTSSSFKQISDITFGVMAPRPVLVLVPCVMIPCPLSGVPNPSDIPPMPVLVTAVPMRCGLGVRYAVYHFQSMSKLT